MADGTLSFTWPKDPQDRLTMQGKYDHMREIARHTEDLYDPHVDEIKEKHKYFRELENFTVKPPAK